MTGKEIDEKLATILSKMLELIAESGKIGFDGPRNEERRMTHQKKCDELLKELEDLKKEIDKNKKQ